MVWILRLQRTHQNLEFGKALHILKAIIFQEEWPARKSAADTPFKPFESWLTPAQQRKDAGELIVGMVGVSKRLCRVAGARHTLQSLFNLPHRGPIDTQQTDDQWFFGKQLNRFIEQSFCLIPVLRHHGRLWRKIDGVLVARVLGSPASDLFPRQVRLSFPDIHLGDTVIDRLLRLEWAPSLVHFASTIQ